MSENRKIQLETEVVANTDGFQQIQQAAQQTATVVQQAGEKASTGIAKIGEGTKRAADSMARDTGRITAEIKRVTLEMQSLGKTASEKFELKIAAKGLDAAQFAPMLAQLKEVESARAAIAAQQTKDNFLGDLQGQLASLREQAQLQGMSADQALRYKAAQAGASAEAAQLITELTQIKAAQEAAAAAAVRQAQAQKEAAAAARVRDNFVADVQGQIEALRLQSMTADEALRYKAAQAGATAETAHLVSQLSAMRAAQEAAAQAALKQAAAEKEAAAAARTRASFLEGLKGRAESVDDGGRARPESDLLALRAAQLGVSKEADAYIAKLRKVEAAHAAVGMSARQTAFAMRQLPMQMTDVVTSLAGGMNPALVLLQQGGQIKDSFGGVGNAIKAVTASITPMVVAVGAGALAFGALGLAMAHVESVARDMGTLQAQLSATGRGDIFSTTELKQFVDEVSKAPGVTREAATQIVSELSKIKEIGPQLFKPLALSVADFARATGTDIPTATRTLAEAFKDPEQGAKTLAKALDGLSSGQMQRVQNLVKEGDLLGAQRLLYQQLEGAVSGFANRGLTPLQTATKDLGNAWKETMRELDNSQGLRNLNTLLAQTIGLVADLIAKGSKTGAIGNVIGAAGTAALGSIPGIGPALVAGNAAANLLNPPPKNPTASGKVVDLQEQRRQAQQAFVQRTIEGGSTDRSEAEKLAELKQQRDLYNKALSASIALHNQEGTSGSEAAKAEQARLRGMIAAKGEQITAAQKKAAGPLSREADQTRAAALEADLAKFRDKLQDERDAMQFHERQLQGQYQAGVVSLKDYYERRKQAIEAGAKAEIDSLEQQKGRLTDELAVERDPSRRRQLEGKREDATREQEKIRTRTGREVDLANDAMAESYRQLSEEVTAYRINLAELQGDEVTAARLRLQQAALQDQRLAKRAEGTPSEIPPEQLRQAAQQRQNRAVLDQAQNNTVIITRAQALEEERIAMAQRAGAIGSLEAMAQVGEARKRAIAQLEEQVRAQEEVAAQLGNENNWQLKLDTAQARQELEKLKEQMDPLAEHFRSLFADITGNALGDLTSGKFGGVDEAKLSRRLTEIDRDFQRKKDRANEMTPGRERDAEMRKAFDERDAAEKAARKDATRNMFDQIKSAGVQMFKQLGDELTRTFLKDLVTGLFAKGGPLGGIPEGLAKVFGIKPKEGADKPLVDTSGITGSLRSLQAGVDPLTASMGRLQGAIDQVAARAGAVPASAGPVTASTLPPAAGATTGDFARFDRGQAALGPVGRVESDSTPTLPTTGDFARLDRATAAPEQAQGALRMLASQGAEPASTALQRFTPATEAATTAQGGADVSLQRLASAADAAAAALQRIAGLQPGAAGAPGTPGAAGLPGLPGPPGAAGSPSFGVVDTAPGGERFQFGVTPPNPFAQEASAATQDASRATAGLTQSMGDASKTAGMATTALSLFAAATGKGNAALALLPMIIQMIQTAAAASSASSAAGGGMGGLGSLFGGMGAAGGGAMGMSQSVSTAGAFFLTPMATGGYTGDVPPDQATGIVHGKEFVFSAPAVKALGVDTLKVLHEKARAGDGGAIGTVARMAGDTDRKPAAAVAGPRNVLHVLRDGGRDTVLNTIARFPERGEPGAPGASGAAGRDVLERRSHTKTILDRMPRYHTGGIVERVAQAAGAKLAPDEVPAILMGGPKGKREEVLTADDPRHKDNMSPAMARFFDKLPRYHEGGIVGAKPFLMPGVKAPTMVGEREDGRPGGAGSGGKQQVVNINVTAGPETTRATAKQIGVQIARSMQTATGSNR